MNERKLITQGIKNIDDFVTLISEDEKVLKQVYSGYIYEDARNKCLESIKDLKGTEKEKRFIKFIRYVDKRFNQPSKYSRNEMIKVPIMLSGALFVDKYEKQFNIYTIHQKGLVAFMTCNEPEDVYKDINLFFPRSFMDYVSSKKENYPGEFELMDVYSMYRGKKTEKEIVNLIEEDENEQKRLAWEKVVEDIEKKGLRF